MSDTAVPQDGQRMPLALPASTSSRPSEGTSSADHTASWRNQRPPGAGNGGSSEPGAEDFEDELTAADRSVDEETIEALYGYRLSRNQVHGSAAFGPGAVAGDRVTVNHPASERPALLRCGRFDPTQVRQLERWHVRAESDLTLDTRLGDRRVVYLDGGSHTGRRASALTVLAGRHGPTSVAELTLAEAAAPASAVHEFDKLLRDCGHLFPLLPGTRLDVHTLRSLEVAARRRDATVIVIGDLRKSHKADLSHYLVAHQAPSPEALFASHMRRALQGRRLDSCGRHDSAGCSCAVDYVEELLKDQAVVDELRKPMLPDEVLTIVNALAETTPRGPAIAARLAETLPFHLRSRAAKAMSPKEDQHHPCREQIVQHQRAFRISYALFHGRPLRDVFDAAARLMNLLEEARGGAPLGRPTYHLTVEELLGDELGPGDLKDALNGPLPGAGNIARLRNPTLMGSILEVAWNDYGGFRLPLLRWTNQLAQQRRHEVWERAASVVGWLTRFDFEQVCHELVDPWAESRKPSMRQVAAYAMEVASHDRALPGRVLAHVRSWLGEGSYRRDTVARVYATRLGLRFPEEALRDLKVIAMDPMQRWSGVVEDAIERLTGRCGPAKILNTMLSWCDAPAPDVEKHVLNGHAPVAGHAVKVLVRLARHLDGQAPMLLASLARGDVEEELLSVLWRRALRSPATSDAAWSALEMWIESVGRAPEDNHTIWRPFESLLRGVFAESSLRKRGRFYLRKVWEPEPSQTFFPVFADLVKEN